MSSRQSGRSRRSGRSRPACRPTHDSGIEIGVLDGYSVVIGPGAAIRIEFDDPADWQWAFEMWAIARPGMTLRGSRAMIASMYVPAHFKPDDDEVLALLRDPGAADLVTTTAEGLLATMLPLVYDEPGSRPDVGPWGALLGHVARNNAQWRTPAIGESMVILRGPDAYISPAWYETKREHGRVVPTWNYITIHAYGRLVVHDDPAWVEANVRRLSDLHEGRRPEPWSVDDAPAPYIDGQLRAIVGVEVVIDRVQGKWKLSQNRSDADIAGVIGGLEALAERGVSAAMRGAGRTTGD